MGTSYTYHCNKCDYSVQTSAGLDWGMLAVTDTCFCKSCLNIVEVIVGVHGNSFTRKEIIKRKLKGKYNLNFHQCPKCGSEKGIRKWNKKDKPCPRCDGKMEKDLKGDVILWD